MRLYLYATIASLTLLGSVFGFAKKPESTQAVTHEPSEMQKDSKSLDQKVEEKKSEPKKEEDTKLSQIQTESKPAETPKTETQDILPKVASNIIDFEQGLSKLADAVLPGVVNISTTQIIQGRNPTFGPNMPDMPRVAPGSPFEDLFRDFFGQMEQGPRKVHALGSGFVIKTDGDTAYVVTNNHVVNEANKITITLHNRAELEATIHGQDARTDLAVLKVDLSKLPKEKRPIALSWSETGNSRVGHFVAAVGNAFGLGNTLSFGVISFKGRDLVSRKTDLVDDFIQHTAPINMGNSGGPLLSMKGEIVGINTAIFTPTGGHVGIGFSIPSDFARKIIDSLVNFGRVKRGWLGLHIQHVDDYESVDMGNKKVIVGGVSSKGPCDNILQQGDIILEFDGIKLDHSHRLTRLVADVEPGKKIKILISRKGEKEPRMVEVVIGESPDNTTPTDESPKTQDDKKNTSLAVESLGVYVREEKDAKGRTQIVIDKFNDFSPLKDLGLRPGDIVLDVNRKDIVRATVLRDIIQEIEKQAESQGVKPIVLMGFRRSSVIRDGAGPLPQQQPQANDDFGDAIFFYSVELMSQKERNSNSGKQKEEKNKKQLAAG